MSNKLIRISNDDYQVTGNELQNNLLEDDVNLLLEEYDEVDDTDILKPGMHVRYYTITQKKNGDINKKFRLGGDIIKIDHENKYLVLTNKRLSWSVQFNNTIFYKKMSSEDIKAFYENELDDKDDIINKLNDKIKSVHKKYKENEKKLLDENARLFAELKQLKTLIKKSGIVKLN
jgi:hypothetical protein